MMWLLVVECVVVIEPRWSTTRSTSYETYVYAVYSSKARRRCCYNCDPLVTYRAQYCCFSSQFLAADSTATPNLFSPITSAYRWPQPSPDLQQARQACQGVENICRLSDAQNSRPFVTHLSLALQRTRALFARSRVSSYSALRLIPLVVQTRLK